jgi:hypothetical protein
MLLDPDYDKYYVYSSVIKDGTQLTYGACPLVWHPEVVLQGGKWKKGLTWADGNYHLYESNKLSTEDAQFVEECMYNALNETDEKSGFIKLDESGFVVRWCLMEEEQINAVMNLPE